ncbi:MAG: DUF3467 domain-containing protein [Holophagales bacterium]|jgi:hypothetical protein|nr:DUF3467 domain-containing protein [Holophagales bacterium]MBK9966815.1 DUF3467 domain-containing protein [Holophagales bacterium]
MADVPPKPEDAPPPTLQFSMDDAVASGVYANFVNIIHNPAEFILDFARAVPGRADVRILSRILTTPVHAKQLLNALSQNIAIYEKNFGPIRVDFEPSRPEPGAPVRPN